jgi:DNA helicase-2/ATP-dependent DNA helicase PcrA
MTPSNYQAAIYDWVEHGTGDAVVNAVAGSGKTTTLVGVSQRLRVPALFLAFNVAIVDELKRRLGPNVDCKTLNGLGHGALGCGLGRNVRIEIDKLKYVTLVNSALADMEIVDYDTSRGLHNLLTAIMSSLVDPLDIDALLDMVAHRGIDFPENFDDPRLIGRVLARVLQRGEQMARKGIISYDDQIYLPVKWGWKPKPAGFVLVDEAQDLSPVKLELALMARAPGGRLLAVGDRFQAIYGFAGAASSSMDTIVKRTNAIELPLSVCYRCPTAVIDQAKAIVPHIEAAPDAPAGEVAEVKADDLIRLVQPGDLILSRKNAPLVRTCIQFIRAKQSARIRGRDIGKTLVSLAQTALDGAPWDTIEDALTTHYNQRAAVLSERPDGESRLVELWDRLDCVRAILEAFPSTSIDHFAANVDGLFGEGQAAIELSSVHRAKGLEYDRVFIIEPESMPLTWKGQQAWELDQEWNLRYVAVTRAKKSLYIAGAFTLNRTAAPPALLEAIPAPETRLAPIAAQPSPPAATAAPGVAVPPGTNLIAMAVDCALAIGATIVVRDDRPHFANHENIPASLRAFLVENSKATNAELRSRVPERYACTCTTCHAHFTATTRERVCRACGVRAVVVIAIKGKMSETPCDARCHNARGTECVCSCGGVRHGERWATGFAPAEKSA